MLAYLWRVRGAGTVAGRGVAFLEATMGLCAT
jgi:hypothetical protein